METTGIRNETGASAGKAGNFGTVEDEFKAAMRRLYFSILDNAIGEIKVFQH